ncbi:hypothetical protein CcaverHIS631_0301540 [Cutaneotrichosporon cavernicola]|nr:hypothetical protein CcaverHIS631_0301540 [Cutaneotrichosporon cavernicola]BEJ05633.1 hypothetical protein CcaverHIS641_0301550 [Cutaneotrichosporon cavernicola]
MLLLPPQIAARGTGRNEFESALDQQLDPVNPPPPPDAEELKSRVPAKYHDYLDVFSPKLSDRLPDHGPNDFSINFDTNHALPRKQKLYRQPAMLNEIGKKYVAELLAKGYATESKSPIACPLMYVPKKGSDPPFRPVVDYQPVNAITKRWHYPLPRADDIFDDVRESTIFTRLDLRSAFYLIRIKEGDEWKSSFITSEGQYEYTIMPFGLTNAPSAFQHMIDDTLVDFRRFACSFVDDILIHSKTPEEHEGHVKQLLERLRERSLFVKAEKCEFDVQTTEFLGHIIRPGIVEPAPSKVSSIMEWQTPTTLVALRAFLGLANFYRRFVANYSKTTKPLHQLTEKNRPWKWTPECQEAFDMLKTCLSAGPVLILFDPDKPIHLEADASKFAIGAVLEQEGPDGKRHPVEYYSRSLAPAELNYDTSDKEMLAIVAALRHWHHYLAFTKHPINIYSDHRNLQYFMTPRAWNPRQNRWLHELLAYTFKIHWLPGNKMTKADVLSRQPALQPKGDAAAIEPRPLLHPGQYDPLPFDNPALPEAVKVRNIALFEEEGDPTDAVDYEELAKITDDSGAYAPLVEFAHQLSFEVIAQRQ